MHTNLCPTTHTDTYVAATNVAYFALIFQATHGKEDRKGRKQGRDIDRHKVLPQAVCDICNNSVKNMKANLALASRSSRRLPPHSGKCD